MSKIRVIDLLNKIANGEDVPEKIKYKNELYVFNKNTETIDDLYRLNHEEGIDWLFHINISLMDIVEIIEEEPQIDIQGMLGLLHLRDFECDKTDIRLNREKINELVKAVKQLDNQINNK